MSHYDDAGDCSGTLVYGNYWYPAEPVACRWVAGLELRRHGAIFALCGDCSTYCDGLDIVVGGFADMHCAYCGSTRLEILPQ